MAMGTDGSGVLPSNAMRYNLKLTNLSITPITREYLEKRLESLGKLLPLDDQTVFLYVELAKTTQHHQSGNIFKAEVNLDVPGKRFRAVAERTDLHTAIDEVRGELWTELEREKEKEQSLLKRTGRLVKRWLRGFYRRQRKNKAQ